MKIGIIGGGAIGLLTACLLQKYHETTLYVRRAEQMALLERDGLVMQDPHGKKHSVHIPVRLFSASRTKVALWIVCVKQTHMQEVLSVLESLHEDTPILFLQNGMGHEQVALQLAQPVYIGLSDHGALKLDDHQVIHKGAGMLKLGLLKGDNSQFLSIVHQLRTPSFPVEIIHDWQFAQKQKLMANAVINPITALFQVENGAIIENEELTGLAKKICEESANILGLTYCAQWAYVEQVIRTTAENHSSMLQDIKAARMTEVDAILGFLLQTENKPKQTIEFFYHSIKALEWERRKVE